MKPVDRIKPDKTEIFFKCNFPNQIMVFGIVSDQRESGVKQNDHILQLIKILKTLWITQWS